jgi:hypothetical protein
MKKIIKYGCYALLAVAVFIAFWLIGGFISTEYNLNKWGAEWHSYNRLHNRIPRNNIVTANDQCSNRILTDRQRRNEINKRGLTYSTSAV